MKNNWGTYIKNFKSYLKIERGLSKNSIDNYAFDIEKLSNYLSDNNIDISPVKIDDETIQQFIYEISKSVNPRSQARVISGLKSFFNYLFSLMRKQKTFRG